MAKSKAKSTSKASRGTKANATTEDEFDKVLAESKKANSSSSAYSWSTIGLALALLVSFAANIAQNPAVSTYVTELVYSRLGAGAGTGAGAGGPVDHKEQNETPIKNPLVVATDADANANGQVKANQQEIKTQTRPATKETPPVVAAPDLALPDDDEDEDEPLVNNDQDQRQLQTQTSNEHPGLAALLDWFKANGGWMSDNLKLDIFPDVGYGLRAVSPISDSDSVLIREDDQVFKVPDKLTINPRGVIAEWNKTSPEMMVITKDTVNKNVKSKFDQQDMIIALQLMIECAKGKDSFWYPYLQMLPNNVPRLDKYTPEEMKFVQDQELMDMALKSAAIMRDVWDKLDEVDSWSTFVDAATDHPDRKCMTFDSFFHYTSIVGSRAYVLRNIKYIVPVADMINHKTKSDVPVDMYAPGINMFDFGFNKYHKRTTDGIVVRSDRVVKAGQPYEEEYGALDNSMYLTKFGFVPLNNPQNCAVVEVPKPTMDETESILGQLRLNTMTTLCINRDGSFGLGLDRHAKAYFGVIGLEKLPKQLLECQSVQGEFMAEYIDASCALYPGALEATSAMVKVAAQKKLSSAQSTLEEDMALLEKFQKGEVPEGMNQQHVVNAMLFRMEEKKILGDIISSGRKQIGS